MNLLILGLTVGLVAIALAKPSSDENNIDSLESVNPLLDNYSNDAIGNEELPDRGSFERKAAVRYPGRPPRPCGRNGCRTRSPPIKPPRRCDPGPCKTTLPWTLPFPFPQPSAAPYASRRKSASGRLSSAESNERVASLVDNIGSVLE